MSEQREALAEALSLTRDAREHAPDCTPDGVCIYCLRDARNLLAMPQMARLLAAAEQRGAEVRAALTPGVADRVRAEEGER